MKRIKEEWVKLINVSNTDGSRKQGFQAGFVGWSGTLEAFVSERKLPGKVYIYFEPQYDEDIHGLLFDGYLRKSYGDLEETDELLILTTQNSIYTFLKQNK